MHRYMNVLGALTLGLAASRAGTGQTLSGVAANGVTAIDIVLEPDSTMVAQAKAVNQRLLAMYPKGFVLGDEHKPHISCLQRYVRTADLDKVYEAVSKVLATEKPTSWTLKAFADTFVVWDKLALTVILVEPTADIVAFQKRLIDAVEPYTVKSGTTAAFVTTKTDPTINHSTIEYVETYVPASSGKKFIPHVTVGVAPPDSVKKVIAEPFDSFTFSPVGVSVYQLGNFGTAAKKLKTWQLTK